MESIAKILGQKTLLVTGGAGFIGANFVRYVLANTAVNIVNVDALTYAGNLENLAGFVDPYEKQGRYVFSHSNICDSQEMSGLLQSHNVDIVVNFAAESHVDRSIASGLEFVRTNVEGTQCLLDASRSHGVEQYIQVSTDEVYGSILPPDKFTESSPLKPNSPYAASKTSADLMVMAAYKTHKFPIKITRCSNNYGPFQFPEKLIPLMISNMLDGKELPVYGKGENIRDWIYVDDHCKGVLAVIANGNIGEVYNLGGNAEVKNIDMVHSLARALDVANPNIVYVTDRLGHDLRYAIDFSKAENELGWKPQVTLEEGLTRTVNWYKENKQWLANIKTRGKQTWNK